MSIKDYWQNNIKVNMKKISAILGDVIITVITVMLFAAKSELDAIATMMMIIMAVKPFIVMYVNLVFKGETEDVTKLNMQLTQKLAYTQELAEYQIKVAAMEGKIPEAVIANKVWNDTNDAPKPEGT